MRWWHVFIFFLLRTSTCDEIQNCKDGVNKLDYSITPDELIANYLNNTAKHAHPMTSIKPEFYVTVCTVLLD